MQEGGQGDGKPGGSHDRLVFANEAWKEAGSRKSGSSLSYHLNGMHGDSQACKVTAKHAGLQPDVQGYSQTCRHIGRHAGREYARQGVVRQRHAVGYSCQHGTHLAASRHSLVVPDSE